MDCRDKFRRIERSCEGMREINFFLRKQREKQREKGRTEERMRPNSNITLGHFLSTGKSKGNSARALLWWYFNIILTIKGYI